MSRPSSGPRISIIVDKVLGVFSCYFGHGWLRRDDVTEITNLCFRDPLSVDQAKKEEKKSKDATIAFEATGNIATCGILFHSKKRRDHLLYWSATVSTPRTQ